MTIVLDNARYQRCRLVLALAQQWGIELLFLPRIKTDNTDSTILAHLLRTDLLPEAYLAPRPIRDLRDVLRYRLHLVGYRTSLKNRIRALLAREGLSCPYSSVDGLKAQTWFASQPWRPSTRIAITGYLETLSHLGKTLKNTRLSSTTTCAYLSFCSAVDDYARACPALLVQSSKRAGC